MQTRYNLLLNKVLVLPQCWFLESREENEKPLYGKADGSRQQSSDWFLELVFALNLCTLGSLLLYATVFI